MRAVHGSQRPPLPRSYPLLKVRPSTHCLEPLAGQKQGACMTSLTARLLEGGLGPLGDQQRMLVLLLGASSGGDATWAACSELRMALHCPLLQLSMRWPVRPSIQGCAWGDLACS